MGLMRSFLWVSVGILSAVIFLGWQISMRGGSYFHLAGAILAVAGMLMVFRGRVIKPLSSAMQGLAEELAEHQGLNNLKSSRHSEAEVIRKSIALLKSSKLRITGLEGEKNKLLDELKQASELDPLTQLLNRRSVQERSVQLLSHARRNKGQLALIILNLDHFKEVNDKHGHAVGDMVLTNLAKVFKDECRGADLLARTGDEEFLVLGIDCNAEQAKSFAERLRERIHRSKFSSLNGQKFRLTASFGVACAYAGEIESFETLFAEADRALHVAKLEGRNRVVLSQLEQATQNFMRQKASPLPERPIPDRPIPDRLDALTV